MYFHFPDSINPPRRIIEYTVIKKNAIYYLFAKLDNPILLYNHLKNLDESHLEIKITACGFSKFFKFYTRKECEVYAMSKDNDEILTI